jgi:hypothetical protein
MVVGRGGAYYTSDTYYYYTNHANYTDYADYTYYTYYLHAARPQRASASLPAAVAPECEG